MSQNRLFRGYFNGKLLRTGHPVAVQTWLGRRWGNTGILAKIGLKVLAAPIAIAYGHNHIPADGHGLTQLGLTQRWGARPCQGLIEQQTTQTKGKQSSSANDRQLRPKRIQGIASQGLSQAQPPQV